MTDEQERNNSGSPIQAPSNHGWIGFIGYVERKWHERAAKKQNETPTDRAARRTAMATVWMAVFTFVLAGVSGFTIWILKNQLREMHEGGIDTHALAQATGDMADAASDQADAAQQFSDTAEDINGRMSNAVDQLKAAANNAKASINATQDAMRLDQRAWVGVSGVSSIDFVETKPWSVNVLFFNSGKTPARNVQISVRYKLSTVPLHGPPEEEIKQLTFRAIGSIPPQGKFNNAIGYLSSGEPSSQIEIGGNQTLASRFQDIKAKHVIIYYFGILKYDDIFGNHRETQYCIFLADPETKQPAFCDSFNDLY